MGLLRYLLIVLRWPWQRQKLFFLTLYYLIIAKLLIIFIPFRYYASVLGHKQCETLRHKYSEEQLRNIFMIRRMIRSVSRHVIWKSKCFDQALAALFLLSKLQLPTTFYFGVQPKGESFEGHAWLRVGENIVTGDLGEVALTQLAAYAKF